MIISDVDFDSQNVLSLSMKLAGTTYTADLKVGESSTVKNAFEVTGCDTTATFGTGTFKYTDGADATLTAADIKTLAQGVTAWINSDIPETQYASLEAAYTAGAANLTAVLTTATV